jgi:hypothetical protein
MTIEKSTPAWGGPSILLIFTQDKKNQGFFMPFELRYIIIRTVIFGGFYVSVFDATLVANTIGRAFLLDSQCHFSHGD